MKKFLIEILFEDGFNCEYVYEAENYFALSEDVLGKPDKIHISKRYWDSVIDVFLSSQIARFVIIKVLDEVTDNG